MKEFLVTLANGQDLTETMAQEAMHQMMSGQASAVHMASYLSLLHAKGETVEELLGSVRAMRDHAVAFPSYTVDAIDTCGTGGDHSGTFNISTAASFVLAAGGQHVVKHGNRASSSQTGSADVLQALDIPLDLEPEMAKVALEETGFCFLFAQAYHPAMKHVGPIRKELGFRTMFNVLGPLTNPARPRVQVLGTPSLSIAKKMAYVLSKLNMEHALVLHAADGLDELSTAAPTYIFEVLGDRVESYTLTPHDFGLPFHDLATIQGGHAAHNAEILRRVFAGEKGAMRDVVVMNAAAGFYATGAVSSFLQGARRAEQLIDQGLVQQKLHEVSSFRRRAMEGMLA
nr:anthranilate phosphoribosyltransferase [Bacilli bacterium]